MLPFQRALFFLHFIRKCLLEKCHSLKLISSMTCSMQDHMNPPKYNQSLKSIIGDYQHRSNKNKGGDDGLMESIVQNKKYSSLTCVDDEYEFGSGHFEDSKLKKSKKKGSKDPRDIEAKRAIQSHKRIITQEERCQFCFNNPSRSTHLTISIGNYCYLMLTPWEPLVEGHCLIVPMQVHPRQTKSYEKQHK